METIYDYDPPEKELKAIMLEPRSREEYLRWTKFESSRMIDLYCLFNMRGEDARARQYLDRSGVSEQEKQMCFFYYDLLRPEKNAS